ncbi:MAG: CxxC-x17-CxxC domain-containing protein [Candidatus Omnitrophota bacterium]
MKKTVKRKVAVRKAPETAAPKAAPKVAPDVADLMYKIEQHLTFLEKKIDTLINQSSQRPAEVKSFPKPFLPFNRPSHSESFSRPSHGEHFDRPRHGGGREENSFRERSMTRAICADCKQECEVPFKPTGERPVYCKECFSKRKDAGTFSGRRDHEHKGHRREDFSHTTHSHKHEGGPVRKHGKRGKY